MFRCRREVHLDAWQLSITFSRAGEMRPSARMLIRHRIRKQLANDQMWQNPTFESWSANDGFVPNHVDPSLRMIDECIIDGSQRGEAYAIPTAAMLHALRLLARTEGLLLDPVYSGKAFAGFL